MWNAHSHSSNVVRGRILVLVAALLAAATSHAKPSAENLATELAKLRAEVDSLASRIELEKEETRNTLRSLAAQKSQLEGDERRNALRVAELERALTKELEEHAREAALTAELKPAVAALPAGIRTHIEQGIPFRVTDRLKGLEKLENRIQSGELTPGTSLTRLWSFVEDELRMARDTGLFKQQVDLGDRVVLSDVMRVGMMMLFFHTPDGAVGRAIRTQEGWKMLEWDAADSREKLEIDRVMALRDALLKKIQSGFFVLPFAAELAHAEGGQP